MDKRTAGPEPTTVVSIVVVIPSFAASGIAESGCHLARSCWQDDCVSSGCSLSCVILLPHHHNITAGSSSSTLYLPSGSDFVSSYANALPHPRHSSYCAVITPHCLLNTTEGAAASPTVAVRVAPAAGWYDAPRLPAV